jgi:hypothetical protein
MRESASELLSHGGISAISVVRTVDSVMFETKRKLYFWTWRANSRHNQNERISGWMNEWMYDWICEWMYELINAQWNPLVFVRNEQRSCIKLSSLFRFAVNYRQWVIHTYSGTSQGRSLHKATRHNTTVFERCKGVWTFDRAALLKLMSVNKRRWQDGNFSPCI